MESGLIGPKRQGSFGSIQSGQTFKPGVLLSGRSDDAFTLKQQRSHMAIATLSEKEPIIHPPSQEEYQGAGILNLWHLAQVVLSAMGLLDHGKMGKQKGQENFHHQQGRNF